MTPELLNKLKHLANIAAHLPADVTLEDEDAALKALHGELAADTVLELIALAERTTAPVSLTDAQIEDLAVKYESFGFGQAGEKSKLSIHGFEPEGLREFARALLSAAPAPIHETIVQQNGEMVCTACGTAAALAGSQVQAAVDAVDAARYRWLRDKALSVDWSESLALNVWRPRCRIGRDQMDKDIDAAAMREQP